MLSSELSIIYNNLDLRKLFLKLWLSNHKLDFGLDFTFYSVALTEIYIIELMKVKFTTYSVALTEISSKKPVEVN